MNMLRILAAALMVLGVAGSADAARKPPVVTEGETARYWQSAPASAAALSGYPAVADKSADVCVSIGYLVNEDGSATDFSLLKSWTSKTLEMEPAPEMIDPFIQSAAVAITQQKRTANANAGKPKAIYTSTAFAFVGASGSAAGQVRSHCDIPDLKEFIARLQEEAYRRGNINKSQLDRRQREFTPGDAAVQDIQRRSGGN